MNPREEELAREAEEEARVMAADEADYAEEMEVAAGVEAALKETRDALYKERGYVVHAQQPYPHEHGCQGCNLAMRCAVCGTSIGPIYKGGIAHCTNGRCMQCHTRHCTGDGIVSDGHGYGPALT